jgi:hypothetical protein
MTNSASIPRLTSEFDTFLFAPIGDDGNGMLLSVLSAFARLDLDPWQEAAELARLPGGKAAQRLASLIAELPDRSSAHRDVGTIAARLIALLPRRIVTNSSAGKPLPRAKASTDAPIATQVLFYVMLMAVVLGAQSLIASLQPAAQASQTHSPAAVSPASPHSPQPSNGRSRGGGLG